MSYKLGELLKDKNIILASASPRRKQLLEGLCVKFTIGKVEGYNESYPASLEAEDVPQYISEQKSLHYQNIAHDGKLDENTIVITSDTIVLLNGEIIGKPKDREDAIKMLHKLSGNKHTVVTGVCIRDCSHLKSFTDTADVWFARLTDDEIAWYVDNYKPYDKAGAYAIQEWIGYAGIKKIHGSIYTVMGLPVRRLYEELIRFIS